MIKENLKYPSRTKGIVSVALAFFMPVIAFALGIAAIVNSRRTLNTNPTSADAKSGYVFRVSWCFNKCSIVSSLH